MKEYYVKIKPCCDNCVHECREEPRWYCDKWCYKNPLPDERTCSEFEFDKGIVRPTVVSDDYLIRNKEDKS